jgi:hypothetical protein
MNIEDQEPEVLPVDDSRSHTMDLARVESPVSDALVLQREPALVLAEARKAAQALMAVMAQKPKKVMMNGEQYIENEDWLTIGHFYGVTAKIESDKFVEFGDVKGWEATAVLVARDGRELGRATAMCLNDEEKWSNRPKKEWAYCLGKEEDCSLHGHSVEDPGPNFLIWVPRPGKSAAPKRARVVTGEEKVPMFQLRSMAQTRASSRVHASVLRFVPVLAGFKGTPAEEMSDAERVDNTPQSAPPVRQDGSGEAIAPQAQAARGSAGGSASDTVADQNVYMPEGLDGSDLPDPIVYLTKVAPGMGSTKGFIWHTRQAVNATGLAIYKQFEQARQWCQEGVPVRLTDKTSKQSGKAYIDKIEAVAVDLHGDIIPF